jgi:YbgC/YbaW family acyl-CoA thioester hydrolase
VAKGVRLDRQAWSAAALQAIADRGMAGVAIEPIAARLGTTKGSFYAHFPNRDALIEAALALWEERGTQDLIAALDSLPTPTARLTALFTRVFGEPALIRAELALLADADHPLVRPVLGRVTARRLAYLTAQFTALGQRDGEARNRAVLSYTAFVGLHQTDRVAAAPLLDPAEGRESYPDFLLQLLLGAAATGPAASSALPRLAVAREPAATAASSADPRAATAHDPAGQDTDRSPYTISVAVRWGDLDGNGHVANSKYLEYATQARFQYLADNGLTFDAGRAQAIGPVVLSDVIEYRRELRMGATAIVGLALSGARRDGARWQFTQTIRTGDQLAATVIAMGGWLSLAQRRLIQPPAELAEIILSLPHTDSFCWLD